MTNLTIVRVNALAGSTVLILGANGMLGHDLHAFLRNLHEKEDRPEAIHAVDVDDCDITNAHAVASLFDTLAPDLVLNCAAYTNVDGAEAEPEAAMLVNCTGAANVADACARTGARMLHVSTDYVFDGRKGSPYGETDQPNPLGAYARSKLEGEREVTKRLEDCVVLRTAWLFGIHGRCFPRAILARARQNQPLRVVTDEIGSPTYTRDLAKAIWAVALSGFTGLLHVANSGNCSRYEQAIEILNCAGIATTAQPIASEQYERAAEIPANSALDCSRFKDLTGHAMRPWREATREFVKELLQNEA